MEGDQEEVRSENSSDKPSETQEGDAEVQYYESENSSGEKKESELMVQDLKDSGEKFDEAI